jgi:catechol 2,3-dioxygenase-like lactoylglutathione lyase family enzyme
MMKINLASVMVEDQDKALRFYTEILGFVKTVDIPVGEFKWLTVVSPNGPDDIELVLEPNSNPAVPVKVYQRALFESGIPGISFGVDDIHKEYARLTALGVVFTMELTVPPCLMTLR